MSEQTVPDTLPVEPGIPAAERRGPLAYLQDITKVAFLDTEAIGRVARDPAALLYGVLVALATSAITLAVRIALAGSSGVFSVPLLVLGPLVGLLMTAVTTAVIHGAAKLLFSATGTYLAVLRVLLCGSAIGCVQVVPVVGTLVGGIWSLLFMMVAFQEVDGIERLQALGLSLGMSVLMVLLGMIAV